MNSQTVTGTPLISPTKSLWQLTVLWNILLFGIQLLNLFKRFHNLSAGTRWSPDWSNTPGVHLLLDSFHHCSCLTSRWCGQWTVLPKDLHCWDTQRQPTGIRTREMGKGITFFIIPELHVLRAKLVIEQSFLSLWQLFDRDIVHNSPHYSYEYENTIENIKWGMPLVIQILWYELVNKSY